ncbi:DUF4184 family protein [Umezawaea tangerina]|uniref:Uncharacterized protein DUF4184 n=1 Tax=Umezawaea tangerina TaxID=84725 RepID=A0A2T0T7H1_9PSEU|nr:DUF4184 family protein [Umezawaea tangerina]PRY41594.1 uncharacterized protein DUF4184 [Umezawaea tangerina]
MPFTLAHPAAILAFPRGPLVPSALVMGSMAPDLTYYAPLPWLDPTDTLLTRTHHASSVFWLDPLLALALLVVFHALLKRPAVALLPPAAAGRAWQSAERFTWRRATAVWWIALSLVIGAATHVGWDSLNSAFGEALSTALDLAGGVLGFAVLLAWTWRWWRTTPKHPVPIGLQLPARLRAVVWGAVVAAPLVLGTVGAVSGVRELIAANGMDHSDLPPHIVPPTWTGKDMAELAVRRFAVNGVAAIGVVLAIFAVGWQLSRLTTGRRGSPGPDPEARP